MVITIFLTFVAFVLGLSFYLGRRTKTSSGYYAAGGQIHWGVNGIAFAGDYLSAASFLGICGMIATMGYDGIPLLHRIPGRLDRRVVRRGRADETPGEIHLHRCGGFQVQLARDQAGRGISTLVVSVCYLIPQMVGAGVARRTAPGGSSTTGA